MKHLQLLDVNGCIGRGAYEKPEFPAASDLLSHMDYLGIERTIVWHYEARDMNPTQGNRTLLECVADNDRLIPAFTITPACFYERGTLDFLKESFSSGRIKALRIFPSVSRFPIRELERILAELAEHKPVLLWDCRPQGDDPGTSDIEYLAVKFPSITYVLTQKMWGGFGSVMDLMWRCPNVMVDISWIHMRENIELLVREFGAERVVFGTGCKAHYGASIVALVHADIGDQQRALIAHGSMERVLGLSPASFTADGDITGKPLWDKCRRGEPLDVEIIDAHAHLGPTTRGWYMPENDYPTQIKKVISHMDRLGVDQILVSAENALFSDCVPGNRIMEEATKEHRGKILGYLSFNPLYAKEMTKELDSFFSRDFFVGFKLLPSYWKVNVQDPSYMPVWEYAEKHSLPILCHTWDDSYNSPRFFEEIVPKYPNASFLLGHSGGGMSGRYESVELANNNPNVFLEFCGSFTTPVDWLETIDQVGIDQVVFGSDTDAHCQAWELGRFLSIPLPDEQLTPALAANMKAILAKRKGRDA